ncbi:hypothetical protein CLOP_g23825, partial [Closterium sp. NIES-67]
LCCPNLLVSRSHICANRGYHDQSTSSQNQPPLPLAITTSSQFFTIARNSQSEDAPSKSTQKTCLVTSIVPCVITPASRILILSFFASSRSRSSRASCGITPAARCPLAAHDHPALPRKPESPQL